MDKKDRGPPLYPLSLSLTFAITVHIDAKSILSTQGIQAYRTMNNNGEQIRPLFLACTEEEDLETYTSDPEYQLNLRQTFQRCPIINGDEWRNV